MVDEDTAVVVAVNEALVFPAATITVDGPETELELSLRVTAAPPDGAALLSVTIPVTLLPPVTLVGLSVSEASNDCLI